ncbi:MAG TPA: hypothetical protein PKA60_01025 [Candidatus Paceibacterota bacterium]|nr:hypothetical protein [Candidatus Paceibacterota bacterium]
MQQISFYLKKFENIQPKDSALKKIIIKVVDDLLKIKLEEREIEVFDGRVNIKKTGSEKTEIFINRKKIQKQIEQSLISGKFEKKIF